MIHEIKYDLYKIGQKPQNLKFGRLKIFRFFF